MISLDGVSVLCVEADYLPGIKPYDHQADADELIRSGDPFFAVNESPTGSGKTYSWLKPAIDEHLDTVAVFPTNALIADQVATAEEFLEEHRPDVDVNILRATSETITDWRNEYGVSKGEALKRRVDQSLTSHDTTLLFTNPDTLTLVRKRMYHHRFVANHFDRFEMVVLDEFHLADVKQRDSLLFLIDEMNELPSQYSRTDRFYFLSATPEGDDAGGRSLLTRLREDIRVDARSLSASTRPTSTASSDWRAVMPPVDLRLQTSKTFRTAETLLDDETLDEFVSFCEQGQTVVMLDGVHEVDQVYEALSEHIAGTVRRITGFSKGNVSEKLASFDVLVSNSAVEVGLDFKPERLVFSAHNAPTLIQRLGRLREIDSPEPLDAWCYLPESVNARLRASLSSESTDERVSREAFERTVNAAFTDECDLSSFSRRWGELEAYQHVIERADDVPSGNAREETLDNGMARIRRHYYEPYGRTFEREDLKRLHKWTEYDLIEELKSYRGSGLQVMVRDHNADEMKLYDLFYLLRWGDVEFKPPERFSGGLTERESRYYDAYARYAVGFCEYYGKIPIEADEGEEYLGRGVFLRAEGKALHTMRNTPDRQRTPRVMDGLSVRTDRGSAPSVDGIDHLRDYMTDAERLCYVVPGHPSTNEAVYGLDDFFFLYSLGEDSIALGTTALYMHCLVQDRIESAEREWEWN